MSYVYVADEELDNDDELALRCRFQIRFPRVKLAVCVSFFAAGRQAVVLQRGRVTWKGIAARWEL